MVSLVGLFADLRLGRQDTPAILRQSGTSFRRSTLRRSRPRRNLLPEQSSLPGEKRPTHRRPVVRLGRLERVHGVMRRRLPFPAEALRQSAAATRRNRLFRLRCRVPDLQCSLLFRGQESHYMDALAAGQRHGSRTHRETIPFLLQGARRHEPTQSWHHETRGAHLPHGRHLSENRSVVFLFFSPSLPSSFVFAKWLVEKPPFKWGGKKQPGHSTPLFLVPRFFFFFQIINNKKKSMCDRMSTDGIREALPIQICKMTKLSL
jgi:hypothetical protein